MTPTTPTPITDALDKKQVQYILDNPNLPLSTKVEKILSEWLESHRTLEQKLNEALTINKEVIINMDLVRENKQLSLERDTLEKLRAELYERSLQVALERSFQVALERDSLREQLENLNQGMEHILTATIAGEAYKSHLNHVLRQVYKLQQSIPPHPVERTKG